MKITQDKPLLCLLLLLVLALMFLTNQAFAAGYPAWSALSVAYATGDIVTYGGAYYECLQPHTSNAGWSPTTAKTLWKQIPEPTPEPTPDPPEPPEVTDPSETPEPTADPPESTPDVTLPPASNGEDISLKETLTYFAIFLGFVAGTVLALIWAWSARRL